MAQLNLTPADIEFVSFSHMHSDHTATATVRRLDLDRRR